LPRPCPHPSRLPRRSCRASLETPTGDHACSCRRQSYSIGLEVPTRW
jgi:hypothetical protein